MNPLEIPIVIYCDANIGSRTTVQHCLMFYGWIGAVLWRPVHVFKTMGACCLCFHNLSLSAWSIIGRPAKLITFLGVFHWFRMFFAFFPLFSTFFEVFPLVSRGFPFFTLEFPSSPGFFSREGLTPTPQWPSVAERPRPPQETLHAARSSANANATYTACMGAYAWGLICLCGVSTFSIFLHPENKTLFMWCWSTEMWPLQ